MKVKPKLKISIEHKGGAGSGHHGHSGRPGKRGGSSPGSGSAGGITKATGDDGFSVRYNTVSQLQDKYSTTKFKVSGSVEGGKQRRYITRIPRASLERDLFAAGYSMVKGKKYTYQHSGGVSARMSEKSGKFTGAYYVYMNVTD